MLPSYQLFNVRAGIANERYDLSLWIKNAADEEYVLGNNNLETFYGGFMRAVGPPRQFGATFSLFF
jgi:outer membrane receptor protein involved in Fe transport